MQYKMHRRDEDDDELEPLEPSSSTLIREDQFIDDDDDASPDKVVVVDKSRHLKKPPVNDAPNDDEENHDWESSLPAVKRKPQYGISVMMTEDPRFENEASSNIAVTMGSVLMTSNWSVVAPEGEIMDCDLPASRMEKPHLDTASEGLPHIKESAVYIFDGTDDSDRATVVADIKGKPKEKERINSKGKSLSGQEAISFMIKERARLDEEQALLRSENRKLKEQLESIQGMLSQAAIADNRTSTASDAPNSDSVSIDLVFQEAQRLREENVAIKRQLLKSGHTTASTQMARGSTPTVAAATIPSVLPPLQLQASTSTYYKPSEGSPLVQKGPLYSAATSSSFKVLDQPSSDHQTASAPSKGRGQQIHIYPTTSSAAHKRNPFEYSEVERVPSLLWDGGNLWKIPYNGKGAPEQRIVAVKRAHRPGPDARIVEVINKVGGVISKGAYGPGQLFMHYPPTLIWYEPGEKNVGKNSRELVLREGSRLVEGHATPAFWKLESRNGPLPREEHCFSIITAARTLDLASESLVEAEDWKFALNHFLVAALGYNDPHEDNGENYVKGGKIQWGNGHNSSSGVANGHSPALSPGKFCNSVSSSPGKPYNGISTPTRPSVRPTPSMEELRLRFFQAAHTGDSAGVEAAHRAGVPINELEPNSADTALMIACREGFVQLVVLCLHCGAKNDPHPDFGLTALHAAVEAGQYDTAKVLLEAAAVSSADTIITNLAATTGKSPLHISAAANDPAMLELLLSHGGDVARLTDAGQTVVHISTLHGRSDALAVLLDHGADAVIDCLDLLMNSALHYAAMKCHVQCARLLLQTAANAAIANAAGLTPYDLAVAVGNLEISELLREYVDAPGGSGSSSSVNQTTVSAYKAMRSNIFLSPPPTDQYNHRSRSWETAEASHVDDYFRVSSPDAAGEKARATFSPPLPPQTALHQQRTPVSNNPTSESATSSRRASFNSTSGTPDARHGYGGSEYATSPTLPVAPARAASSSAASAYPPLPPGDVLTPDARRMRRGEEGPGVVDPFALPRPHTTASSGSKGTRQRSSSGQDGISDSARSGQLKHSNSLGNLADRYQSQSARTAKPLSPSASEMYHPRSARSSQEIFIDDCSDVTLKYQNRSLSGSPARADYHAAPLASDGSSVARSLDWGGGVYREESLPSSPIVNLQYDDSRAFGTDRGDRGGSPYGVRLTDFASSSRGVARGRSDDAADGYEHSFVGGGDGNSVSGGHGSDGRTSLTDCRTKDAAYKEDADSATGDSGYKKISNYGHASDYDLTGNSTYHSNEAHTGSYAADNGATGLDNDGSLEIFESHGIVWNVFQTDDGYTYYLDMSKGHSQWDDPRYSGIVNYAE